MFLTVAGVLAGTHTTPFNMRYNVELCELICHYGFNPLFIDIIWKGFGRF